ncbi:MAG TPA: hypothetical protein VMY37_17375 [Thermoguttaceae bacterium]|nr:hypothetical protein [Thermoguttaceae bacterium]
MSFAPCCLFALAGLATTGPAEHASQDALSPRLAGGVKDRYLKRWKTELSRAQ